MTSFTDSTKTYATTPESCNCPAARFNHGSPCKHVRLLRAEANKAQRFLLLMARFDCRANGDEVTHRINFEMSLGY